MFLDLFGSRSFLYKFNVFLNGKHVFRIPRRKTIHNHLEIMWKVSVWTEMLEIWWKIWNRTCPSCPKSTNGGRDPPEKLSPLFNMYFSQNSKYSFLINMILYPYMFFVQEFQFSISIPRSKSTSGKKLICIHLRELLAVPPRPLYPLLDLRKLRWWR